MPSSLRRQLDDGILDRAAALFARRGVAKTSVQEVADAVGLSKAGLLHHYPSKDTLHRAVLDHAGALGRSVHEATVGLPVGPVRDRQVLELVVDLALANPGTVALLLSPVRGALDEDVPQPDAAGDAVLEAFGVTTGEVSERSVRVGGALSALAVLTVSAHEHGEASLCRPHIVATCFDALGHHRDPPPSTHVISTHSRARTSDILEA